MQLADLRKRQNQRRKQRFNKNSNYYQAAVIETGNTLKVQLHGSLIEVENLAGGAELGDQVLIYHPQNSGLPTARTKSGTVS